MKAIVLLVSFLCLQSCFAQTIPENNPVANVRLSFLLFPLTPLLTLEVRTIGDLTLQLETNFVNTHGANLKYFTKNGMDGHYVFIGIALVENRLLRQDDKMTFLPYAGYGYAYRFGNKNQWTFDSRIGIGATTNADRNSVYPVIKTGIGRIF
ncbi:MAG: hypothetical protein HYZ44_03435 [Bacteroidetes bacterium]|nr:hypothetical protein [Bacteroidota bacterium]